jgi:hypothetical protein
METHLRNKKKRTKNKSLTPQRSSIRKKAITPLQVEEPTSSSKKKKAKKKLVFNEATEQGKVKDKNILNLPYSDSESEPMVEETPGYQVMEPAMEDTPKIEVSPSLDKAKSSSINKYENLTKNVAETRASFDKLALVYVK